MLACLSFHTAQLDGFPIQTELLNFINSGPKCWGSLRIPGKRKFTVRYLTDAATEKLLQAVLLEHDADVLANTKFGLFTIDGVTSLVWTGDSGRTLIEATLTESIRALRSNRWPVRPSVNKLEDLFESQTQQDFYDRIENRKEHP